MTTPTPAREAGQTDSMSVLATAPRPDRILVVDDSAMTRRLLGDVIEAAGYAVLMAQDGLEAIARVRDQRPDLVVLDVNLPGQDGYAVCRQIRDHPDTQHIPVLFVSSAHPDVPDRVRGLEAGGNDYLPSPFVATELLARIRALLRTKRTEDELRVRQQGLESLNRQLLALQAVSAQMVATLDLDVLVHRVTEALVQHLGYRCAVLLLVQEPGDQVTLNSIHGIPISLVERIEAETGRDMTRALSVLNRVDATVYQQLQQGQVLDADQIIQALNSLDLGRAWEIFQQQMGVDDMLFVPLMMQDRMIGGFWVMGPRPDLAPIEVDILRILADQVAVAIYNARLHANVVLAQEQASLLLDIQSAIAARLELQPILTLVLGGAVRALEATSGLLALANAPDQTMVVQTSYGLPPGADATHWPGVTDGVLGQVMATGRSRHVDQVHNLASDPWAHELGLHALVIVPIQLGERVIGVLSVHDRSGGRPFTLHDEQLLSAITDQAAVAIEQARLYEEVRRRAQEQAALILVAETANRSLELPEILETSLQRVLDVSSLPCGMIYLPSAAGEQLILAAHHDASAGLLHQTAVARLDVDPAQEVFRTGQVMIINLEPAGRSRPMSLAVIPLQAKGVTLGVMEVGGLEAYLVTDQDQSLLLAIGHQIGVAVENAQLYAETQQRVRELAALNRAAIALGESLDLDTVLHHVLEHIQSLTQAQYLIAYLREQDGAPLRQCATWGLPEPGALEAWVPATDLFGESAMYEVTALSLGPGARPPESALLYARGIRTVVLLPLRSRGARVGVVYALFTALRVLGAVEQQLLDTISRQAGVAVENALLYQASRRRAITDGLTGLYNYRYLHEVLDHEIARSQRYNGQLTLLMLDVDNFKDYNDLYGHLAGDDLLVTLAHLIQSQIRQLDTAVRYGGEEMAILLPETGRDQGLQMAERIRQVVAAHAFVEHDTQTSVQMTVSMGVACFPDDASNARGLVYAADMALYAAKHAGKNCVLVANGPAVAAQPRNPT